MSHLNKLKEACEIHCLKQLREYFRKPDFGWIEKMIDEVYDDPTNIDEISNKYNVEFEEGGESNSIITDASYRDSDNKYHVWLSDDSIDHIKKGINKNALIRELELFLTHENIHLQQNQLKQSEQPYFSNFDPDKWEEVKKYMSQYIEIPAMASSVSKDLFIHGYTDKDLDNLTNISDLTKRSISIIELYQRIGGKVWQQFLTEIFRWFNEPYVGTEQSYRDWLKRHRN